MVKKNTQICRVYKIFTIDVVIQATLNVSKKKAGGGTVSVECSFVGNCMKLVDWLFEKFFSTTSRGPCISLYPRMPRVSVKNYSTKDFSAKSRAIGLGRRARIHSHPAFPLFM